MCLWVCVRRLSNRVSEHTIRCLATDDISFVFFFFSFVAPAYALCIDEGRRAKGGKVCGSL